MLSIDKVHNAVEGGRVVADGEIEGDRVDAAGQLEVAGDVQTAVAGGLDGR